MFHLIRQNGSGSPAVLIRILDVLGAVVALESDPQRVAGLQRHADLTLESVDAKINAPSDIADIQKRHRGFLAMKHHGPLGHLRAMAKA
jgi:uncharacterized membrane protein